MADLPISIRGLSAGYGRETVLRNIDLDLYEDDFLAVIGPNGGGKTTLFRSILGLITPTEGSIRIYGEEPSKGVRNVGYVPQFGAFDNKFPISAEEVVLMGMRSVKGVRPRYSKEERELAESAMEFTGMVGFRDKRIGDLSGGQLQRVLLARALAPKPRILLLDEPTASLDPSMRDCTYDILKKVCDEGVSIMLITHDMAGITHDVKRLACINRTLICNDRPEITAEMVGLGFHCPPEFLKVSGKVENKCSCGHDHSHDHGDDSQ